MHFQFEQNSIINKYILDSDTISNLNWKSNSYSHQEDYPPFSALDTVGTIEANDLIEINEEFSLSLLDSLSENKPLWRLSPLYYDLERRHYIIFLRRWEKMSSVGSSFVLNTFGVYEVSFKMSPLGLVRKKTIRSRNLAMEKFKVN